jgi:hypothetical protein
MKSEERLRRIVAGCIEWYLGPVSELEKEE